MYYLHQVAYTPAPGKLASRGLLKKGLHSTPSR